MFERIKCYKNLRRNKNILLGLARVGKITQDEKMVQLANEALYNTEVLKKRMWRNRKLAEKYNLEILKHGFH